MRTIALTITVEVEDDVKDEKLDELLAKLEDRANCNGFDIYDADWEEE